METLIAQIESDSPNAEASLATLRQNLLENPAPNHFLAKAIHETQVRFYIRRKNKQELARALVQLRPWGMSDEFAALELLLFLVTSRLADFFASLELLSLEERQKSSHVGFVVSLERHLTEGSYNQVLNARKNATSPMFGVLLEDLEHTVRDEIASCVEVAYKKLTVSKGVTLLNLGNAQNFIKFAESRNWPPVIQTTGKGMENYIDFTSMPSRQQITTSKSGLSIASFPGKWVVQESLNLASDLDRIV
jgi:hypothetical protein